MFVVEQEKRISWSEIYKHKLLKKYERDVHMELYDNVNAYLNSNPKDEKFLKDNEEFYKVQEKKKNINEIDNNEGKKLDHIKYNNNNKGLFKKIKVIFFLFKFYIYLKEIEEVEINDEIKKKKKFDEYNEKIIFHRNLSTYFSQCIIFNCKFGDSNEDFVVNFLLCKKNLKIITNLLQSLEKPKYKNFQYLSEFYQTKDFNSLIFYNFK